MWFSRNCSMDLNSEKMVTLGISPAQNPPPKPSLWIMGRITNLGCALCKTTGWSLYIYIMCVMYMYIIYLYIYTYIPYISEYFSKRAYSQSSQHVRIPLGQGHLCSQFPIIPVDQAKITPAKQHIEQASNHQKGLSQVIPRHSTFWPIATPK